MASGDLPSAVEGAHTKTSSAAFMLRALKYRNYRLFFTGQGVSLLGTWLTTTATSWLVFRLVKNTSGIAAAAGALGIVRFAAQIPMSVLAPAAGVLIDRWKLHRVLVATQALSLVQSALLAIQTFSGRITVEQLVGLSIFQGLINAFDAPARQAFVAELVERREDLPNAIALNSSMFNGARLVGPAVAGLLIARIGEAWCFSIDAVSYLAVLIALLQMKIGPRKHRVRTNNAFHELKEGFTYALGFGPVRELLLLAGIISFMVASYQTLMPIFADRAAGGGEHGAAVFGFLGAAVGVGSLAGAIYLAARRSVVGLGRAIAFCAMLGGLAMIGFASTSMLPVMLITAVIAGFGMIVTFAACNTLLQTIVEDDMRGRLMSFFVVSVMGAAPLGSLAAGWVAGRIGEPRTVFFAGIASILAAGWFLYHLPAMRALVHPIYVKRGILPEVATGLAAADRMENAKET